MSKYIHYITYIITLTFFITSAYAQSDNVTITHLELQEPSILMYDQNGNEIKNNIVYNQDETLKLENDIYNLFNMDKMQNGKYRITHTNKKEEYTSFLVLEFVPVFFAKLMIAYEAFHIDKQSKSNALYDVFDLGYQYNEEKDTQLSCNDSFIKGDFVLDKGWEYYQTHIANTSDFAWRNRVLEKAKAVINQYVQNEGEESSENSFFLALAEYTTDGFNNLPYIQEKMKKVIDNGATIKDMTSYLETYGFCAYNQNKCHGLSSLMIKSLEFQADNPVSAFEKIRDNGLLNYATFLNGFFNIYNDNFYEMVQISKINEQSVINIFEDLLLEEYDVLYPRYYKIKSDNKNQGDTRKYTPLHCTNNVYYGNLYIFPYNNVTYIINTTETENKIVKMEVRSPKFFNTDYGKNYHYGVLVTDVDTSADIRKNVTLHMVSHMNRFSYKDNIVYSMEYKKQPQSPLGDVDKLKERRGEKIIPDKVYETIGAKNFTKGDLDKEVDKFMEYLQKYSSQKLIDNELYFYDVTIDKKQPVIIASAYFYNNNGIKTESIFLLDKNLKMLDEKIALSIDNAVNNNKFYKSIVYKTDTSVFIGFIQRDNKIFVVNIEDNQVGSGIFPIYYYESENVKIDKLADYESFSTNLIENAQIDCKNIYNKGIFLTCSQRSILTAVAYIEELYKTKMETAEKYFYPDYVKDSLTKIYDVFKKSYSKNCGEDFDYNQCMDTILSYENIFKY